MLIQILTITWKQTCSLDNPRIKGTYKVKYIVEDQGSKDSSGVMFLDSNSESYSLCDAQTDMSSDDDAVVVNKEVNEAVNMLREFKVSLLGGSRKRAKREDDEIERNVKQTLK